VHQPKPTGIPEKQKLPEAYRADYPLFPPIHYVGNPTVDEVTLFRAEHPETFDDFVRENNLNSKPIIALLLYIRDNNREKYRVHQPKPTGIPEKQKLPEAYRADYPYYHEYIGDAKVNILFSQTYRLLQQAEAALVTSGSGAGKRRLSLSAYDNKQLAAPGIKQPPM